MLRPQEALLESSAKKIARIITREYGIDVCVGGAQAYIDLQKRVIHLPDLTKEQLAFLGEAFDGFLDHESAHALFTDATAIGKVKSGSVQHTIWNCIEDYYVEKRMSQTYIGAGQNISLLNNLVDKDLEKKWNTLDGINRLLIALAWIWRDQKRVDDYVKDPQIGSLLPALQEEITEGFTVNSTAQCIALSARILDKIKDLSEQQKNTENSKGGKEDTENSDRGNDSNKAPASVENTDPSQNSQDQDNEETEGDTEPTEANNDDSGDSGDSGDSEDADTKHTKSDSTEEEGKDQALAIQEAIDSGDIRPSPLDKENWINGNLSKVQDRTKANDPEEYIVFSEQFDYDTEYPIEYRQKHTDLYNRLRGEVSDYIGNMATTLESALAAQAEARWVGGYRRGRKWDQRKLLAWYQGSEDDRICKRLEQGETFDTAVLLLWDCSGSMGCSDAKTSKSYLARLAAIALHEALTRTSVVHAVYGFNTGGKTSAELSNQVRAAKDAGHDLSNYSRLDETDQRMIFVPFGSTDGRAICAIDGRAANRDGECVLWAARHLAARPEKRKILIVGSDGQPSGARFGYTEKKYLQTVVRQVIDAGIELLAVGIMDSSVKKYYPDWVVIERATDLPAVLVSELSKKLLKGAHNDYPEFFRKPDRSVG